MANGSITPTGALPVPRRKRKTPTAEEYAKYFAVKVEDEAVSASDHDKDAQIVASIATESESESESESRIAVQAAAANASGSGSGSVSSGGVKIEEGGRTLGEVWMDRYRTIPREETGTGVPDGVRERILKWIKGLEEQFRGKGWPYCPGNAGTGA